MPVLGVLWNLETFYFTLTVAAAGPSSHSGVRLSTKRQDARRRLTVYLGPRGGSEWKVQSSVGLQQRLGWVGVICGIHDLPLLPITVIIIINDSSFSQPVKNPSPQGFEMEASHPL